jgi:hypothetical protein
VVQDVSSPNSITVIAVEVLASPDNPATIERDFESTVVLLSALGSVTTENAGLSATVALEPDADVPVVISRLDSIIGVFEERHSPARLRALMHYGTAFRATSPAGVPVFKGSALRSACNSLRRSSVGSGIYATADFSNFVTTLKGASGFTILDAGPGELSPIVLADHRRAYSNELHSTDPELVAWLKARLASDLGPFATALIDNASHSTRTAKELAAAVGHEIVNPIDRQRFDADVFKYLRSRNF